jgi:hypothetical protein
MTTLTGRKILADGNCIMAQDDYEKLVKQRDELAATLRGVAWKLEVYGSHWQPSRAELDEIARVLQEYHDDERVTDAD